MGPQSQRVFGILELLLLLAFKALDTQDLYFKFGLRVEIKLFNNCTDLIMDHSDPIGAAGLFCNGAVRFQSLERIGKTHPVGKPLCPKK